MRIANGLILAAATCLAVNTTAQTVNPTPTATIPDGQMHIIGSAKLIVKDAAASNAYYSS